MTSSDDRLAEDLRDALHLDVSPSERDVLEFRNLVETTFSAQQSDRPQPSNHLRPSSRRFAAVALAAAACLLVIAVIGVRAIGTDDGKIEFDSVMVSPDRGAEASVVVRAVDTGRVITLRTGELPILPTGEYYEFWFVSADDRPGAPDRISAGTFHPDTAGNSDITLLAAVDPALYPRIEVTAEPGDGDPASSGVIVLEAAIG